MSLLRNRIISWISVFSLFMTGCSQDYSIQSAFVRQDDLKRFDQLLVESKAKLDAGSVDEATSLALKAYNMNPNSASLNIHLAYLYLAKAGLDPMNIIQKLVGDLSSSTKDPNSGASSLMTSIGSLADISDSDLKKMIDSTKYSNGTDDGSDDPKYFSNIPILAPAKPGLPSDPKSVRGSVKALVYINKIISLTCPYIDPKGLRKDADARHKCATVDADNPALGSEKAGLLFSLAHLAEAAIFQQVVLYKTKTKLALTAGSKNTTTTTTTSDSLSNLFARAEKVNTTVGISEITDYVHAVSSLESNVNDVFDTDSSSMFASMLSDLKSSSNTLAHVAGLPESFVQPISDAVDSIATKASTIGSSETQSGAIPAGTDTSLIALKQQLNGAMAAQMKTSISNVLSSSNTSVSEEQKTSLCSSYKNIANTSTDLPTGC